MPGHAQVRSMFPSMYDETAYAWIITRDLLWDDAEFPNYEGDHSDAGVSGPSQATELQIHTAKTRGREFRILDDDGEVYYHGRIWTACEPGTETDFGPLWDFGTPNAGATDIQYKADGSWTSL